MALTLADFDDTGLTVEVLMLCTAGTSSQGDIYRNTGIGTLHTGSDAALDRMTKVLGRIRWGSGKLTVNGAGDAFNSEWPDPSPDPAKTYNDSTFYVQIDGRTNRVEIPMDSSVSGIEDAGGGFMRTRPLTVGQQAEMNTISVGTMFLFAIGRAGAAPTPAFNMKYDGNPVTGVKHNGVTATAAKVDGVSVF